MMFPHHPYWGIAFSFVLILLFSYNILLATCDEENNVNWQVVVNLGAMALSVVVLVGSVSSDLPLNNNSSSKANKILGAPEYDLQALFAPTVQGTLLRMACFLVRHPWFGHLIRRPLINLDHPAELRDLANQAAQQKVPIVFYPLSRATPKNATNEEMAATATNALQKGLSISYDNQKIVGIMDYYKAYSEAKVCPSQMMFRVLEAIDKLQYMNMFVQVHRDYILEQAKESDMRWEAKKPLSVFDGVPVAVKGMLLSFAGSSMLFFMFLHG